MQETAQAIPIYIGTPLGGADPRVHFWYYSPDGTTRRICDDGPWPHGRVPRSGDSIVYVPCTECRGLYVDDLVDGGQQRFDPHPYLYPSPYPVIDSLEIRESKLDYVEGSEEMNPIAVSTFARYYEATDRQRLRIVKELLTPGMDYYWALRNTLAETHWRSDDISTFEDALDGLLRSVKSPTQRNHYENLALGYIAFWKKRLGAHVFMVPTVFTEVAGLPLRVSTEIGMAYRGDQMALKLYLRATPPTRKFREAIQHITMRARGSEWNPNWQPAILDVRREDMLHPVALGANFEITIESQALAFIHTWEQFSTQGSEREH